MAAIPLATTPILRHCYYRPKTYIRDEKIQCKKEAAVVVILPGTTT